MTCSRDPDRADKNNVSWVKEGRIWPLVRRGTSMAASFFDIVDSSASSSNRVLRVRPPTQAVLVACGTLLIERKLLLRSVVPHRCERLLYRDHVEGDGEGHIPAGERARP